jgi:hypothetical protein
MKRVFYLIVGFLADFLAVGIAAWTGGNLYTFSYGKGGVTALLHKQALLPFIPAFLLFGTGIYLVSKAISWKN